MLTYYYYYYYSTSTALPPYFRSRTRFTDTVPRAQLQETASTRTIP